MVFFFDHFELRENDFCLYEKGERIALEPKALRVLLLLVSKAGHMVEKGYLLKTVWNDSFVEENALTRTILVLRRALGDNRRDRILIETVPTKGYRFVAEVQQSPEEGDLKLRRTSQQAGEMKGDAGQRDYTAATKIHTDLVPFGPDSESAVTALPLEVASNLVARKQRWWIFTLMAILAAALAVGTLVLRHRKAPVISELDTVVLADFDNSTSDPVFDDTLKQALAISLRQSPSLNLLSDQRVNTTLQLMTLLPNTQLTPAIAREVCQRAGGNVYVAGSIASIENEYVIGLKAVNCQSGDMLALEQAHAEGKQKVLDALDKVAVKVRSQLGESLSSIQKFDTPIEQATTSSFEALKAYSLGDKIESEKGQIEAMPFYRRAIELDPDFAAAYASLGAMYATLGERAKSIEYFDKAFQLRNRATELEKYIIEILYYSVVTGEIEESIEVGQLMEIGRAHV